MTSNDSLASNWGEQRIARRNRRRSVLAGAVVLVSVIFGISGQYIRALGGYIAPADEAADAGSLLWAAGLLAMMGIFAWFIGREIDERGRRIVVNAIAAAGVTSIVLLLLAQAAGKLLPLAEPMHAIWLAAMLTILAAIVFQRIRG